LDAQASDHFGSAPFFTLVDTDSGVCEVVDNSGHGHGGACTPLELLQPKNLDAVACKGMGRRAIMMMGQAGIEVLFAPGNQVSDIVEAARQGTLQPLSPDQACGGHHQRGHCHD
jgi:predicted Fe-Mo cluster-binding NifX family protein